MSRAVAVKHGFQKTRLIDLITSGRDIWRYAVLEKKGQDDASTHNPIFPFTLYSSTLAKSLPHPH